MERGRAAINSIPGIYRQIWSFKLQELRNTWILEVEEMGKFRFRYIDIDLSS